MQEDVSAMELDAGVGATGEGVKVFKHVLPRLDPDLYQCSIPEEMQSLSAEEEAGSRIFGLPALLKTVAPS